MYFEIEFAIKRELLKIHECGKKKLGIRLLVSVQFLRKDER